MEDDRQIEIFKCARSPVFVGACVRHLIGAWQVVYISCHTCLYAFFNRIAVRANVVVASLIVHEIGVGP